MGLPDFGNVLCPMDLSDHSKAALYVAAGFANTPGSKLVVLHVDADGDSPDTRARVDAFIGQTLPGWFAYRESVQTIVRRGHTGPAIVETARHLHAQLIVMGTRGRGVLGRALLGSTSAEVLRESPVPVAVVPAIADELVSLEPTGSRSHLGIVLVPVDLVTPSSPQLAWAARMSGGSKHRLLMLHVVPDGADPGHATERMRALGNSVPSAHGFKLLVTQGDVVEQICHVIRHDHIRFVILGRDASAPGKLAYPILRDTHAAVVMVPN